MAWKRGRSKDELLVPGLSQCKSVNCASTAGDVGSIPGRGTKIPHTVSFGQKKKKASQVWLVGQIQSGTCIPSVHEFKMVFTF